jgi:hypothetical protein
LGVPLAAREEPLHGSGFRYSLPRTTQRQLKHAAQSFTLENGFELQAESGTLLEVVYSLLKDGLSDGVRGCNSFLWLNRHFESAIFI